MIINNVYTGKKVLVVGLGRSGVSAANLLSTLSAAVTVADEKNEPELAENLERLDRRIAKQLGDGNLHNICTFDQVVISPGVPWEKIFLERARGAGIEVISELELASRFLSSPIIAITGANGKTTTVTMLGEILKAAGKNIVLGGNIGTPLCEAALHPENWDYIICEVSSFQLEGIKRFRPYISSILNLTPDHLDRHPDFSHYAGLKKRVYLNQDENGYCLLNLDDPVTSVLGDKCPASVAYFSREKTPAIGAFLKEGKLMVKRGDGASDVMPVSELQVLGPHNIENALAAIAIADICGVPMEAAATGLKRFKGIPHRLEYICEVDGVRFFNDSKGTNVAAAVKSIESFDSPITLIAGGKDKGSDYAPLGKAVKDRAPRVVLIGEAAMKIKAALKGCAEIHGASDLISAVHVAFELSHPGEVVLLAPACSSFDMFVSYEDRGNIFRKAALAIKKSKEKHPHAC